MASNNITPTKTGRIWKDRVLRYSYDWGNKSVLLRIRTLQEDGSGILPSVITPLYAARFVNVSPFKVPGRQSLEPRQLRLCYLNPNNQTGKSELTVYVPYSPDDLNWKAQIQETFNLSNADGIEYKGETKPFNYV